MGKAILIVDMPESLEGEVPCKHCQMHVAEYDDYYHHYVCQGIRIVDGDVWEIYKKCPLMPLLEEPKRNYYEVGVMELQGERK